MITVLDHEVHIHANDLLLVLEKAVFLAAIKRGKAYRRAQALRAREAQMAEAAERKRRAHAKGDA